jgi:hypothetical protein
MCNQIKANSDMTKPESTCVVLIRPCTHELFIVRVLWRSKTTRIRAVGGKFNLYIKASRARLNNHSVVEYPGQKVGGVFHYDRMTCALVC